MQYKKLIFKKFLLGFILLVLLIIFTVLSLKIGEFDISITDLIRGKLDDSLKFIVLNLRFTRTIGAIITGAAIGISGAVLQNILRNPLASPFTLGVSQGAAFGATFAIIILQQFFHFYFMLKI